MRYHFFIGKPSSKICCSRLLQQFILNRNGNINWSDNFLPFDVKRVSALLQKASCKPAGTPPMFKIRQLKEIQDNPLPSVLAVTTEYHLAPEVIVLLSKHLEKEGLVLFDAEMGCLDAVAEITPLERQEMVIARLAHQRYCIALRDKMDSIDRQRVSVFKLGDCFCLQEFPIHSTIDTSIALLNGILPDATKQLHTILLELADEYGEHVYCKDGCFIVENDKEKYRLRFVLEGTGKFPMYLSWVENGEVKLEMLHRMGVFRARKSIAKLVPKWSQLLAEEEYIRSRIYFREAFPTRGSWRNPADRFVDSYKISRNFTKNNLEILYGRHPLKTCSEFCFRENEKADSGWDSWKKSSRFMLFDDMAAPLQGLVEAVIPYYFNYYYDSLYICREEVEQILDKYKELRPIILKNPQDARLGTIARWLIEDSRFAYYPLENATDDKNENQKRSLFTHRKEVVALYDFFVWWLTEQWKSKYEYNGFCLEGP